MIFYKEKLMVEGYFWGKDKDFNIFKIKKKF